MATTTENLGLTLPAGTEKAEISVLNENFQTLDTFAGQATADIQEAQETANAAAPQATTYTKDEVDAAIEEAIEHGGGGTTDYTELTNKPSINGVTLTGNKTTSDLGIEENVQADWDEADSAAPSYIKNKPNIPAGVVVDTTYNGTSENAQAGTAVAQAISTKVDKVTGKGLSTNDFTNADKTKLEGIESGAEANVQADWTQTDTTADDYIKNKPTIPSPVTVDQTYSAASANAQSGVAVAQAISTKVDKVTGKGLSTNDFTNTDKANLATALTKANAAAPQSTTYTKTEVDTALAAKLNTSDVDADLNSTSVNPVQNKVVKDAIDGKQDSLSTAQLAAVNSGIESEDVAQIETNKNNITLLAMRKVYGTVHNTSVTHTYSMKVSDFNNSQAGTYLITIVTWSATPSFSLYAVSYSGNNVTTVTNLTKIAGADANISVTDGVISCTTTGKIQIIAIQ